MVLLMITYSSGYWLASPLSLSMRRDSTNPSKVLSSRGRFDIREYPAEDVNVRAVPLADPPSVAILTRNSPDLPVLMVVINRESPLASGGRWLRDWLEADGALSML
jgi:hypothetical protein